MPNYNHASFLKERMDSILAQDFHDFELIILDDASTDDSLSILREYENHPQVKTLLVNQSNSANTFVQWQKGLEQAEGEYIWIAESDDVADKHFLSRMVAQLQNDDSVLAFCRSKWIDEKGKDLKRSYDRLWHRNFQMDGYEFVRRYLLGYCTICNASAVVFKREALANVDMSQVAKFTASGDRLFWISIALQGRISYVANPLNSFRQHTNKVSGSAEYQGLNIVQDHEIYRLISPRFELTSHEKYVICGYHWKAILRTTVSDDGKLKAIEAWKAEPEFGRLAYLVYLLHRAKEKC